MKYPLNCTAIIWLTSMLLFGCANDAVIDPQAPSSESPTATRPSVENIPVPTQTSKSPSQPRQHPTSTAQQAGIDLYNYTRHALPDYARLALRPVADDDFLTLPPHYYAVQLFALSSPDRVEAYVKRTGLASVSAARIENNGKLLYVLLLGVYETRELALKAIASLPSQIDKQAVWVRPLGELQQAVARANDLADNLDG